jgi:RHS repeat-associated protein
MSMAITNFIWDELSDNVLLETDENNTLTARYTNRPEQFGKLISQYRIEDETLVRSFYHYDGEYSTSALTDENEDITDTFTYTAYGEEVARTGTTTNPFGYKGAVGYYTNESTNEIYVRNRTYEPQIGRWLSTDPLGFIDGTSLYRAYFVPYRLDWSGTCATCRGKGPYGRVFETFDVPELNVQWNGEFVGNTEELYAQIKSLAGSKFRSLGEYDIVYFSLADVDKNTAGLAGLVYGVKFKDGFRSLGHCCTFPSVRLDVMSFTAVIKNTGGGNVTLPGGTLYPGPKSTREHERWHTDGPDWDWNRVKRAAGPGVKLIKYPGYNTGANRYLSRWKACVRKAATKYCPNILTDADCNERLRICWDSYFSPVGIDGIKSHGHWHKPNGYHWNDIQPTDPPQVPDWNCGN